MKNIFFVIGLFITCYSYSQSTVKTETFLVKGNCEECKKRIENAADIKGVKISNWDAGKKILSVTYDTKKISIIQVQKAIAAKGYDAGNEKADTKAYDKLPKCCQYNDRTHQEATK